MKEIIDRLDFIKIKHVSSVKYNVNRMRRQVTAWEKIFIKDISDTGVLSKICKEILKLQNKKTKNPIVK